MSHILLIAAAVFAFLVTLFALQNSEKAKNWIKHWTNHLEACGIAFGGGGSRGFAHLGVIKALG